MTKDHFEAWQSFEGTKEVKELIEKRIKQWEENLVELAAGCNNMDTLSIQAARLAGMIMGANELVQISWEDFET